MSLISPINKWGIIMLGIHSKVGRRFGLEVILSTCGIVIVLGGITLLANLVDARQDSNLQILLIVAILAINLMVITSGLLALTATDDFNNTAIGTFVLAVAVGLASLLLHRDVREWIARFFPKPIYFQQKPKTDLPLMNTLGFRPESWVHTWALILVVLVIGWQFSSYFLAGGLSGVAEDIAVDYPILLSNLLPNVLIPFLGVGIFLRRSPQAAMQRLGLGKLTLGGLGVSLVLTVGLLMMVGFFSVVWSGVVSEETFEEQTEASSALAESINTVGLAFTLAATAAIGEEIAFRGALQPIFGFWATALIFAISHVQYTLTPASLLIFFVAIALGWVRKQFNTTTAILVHFLYNFVPLLLLVVAEEETTSGFIRLLF